MRVLISFLMICLTSITTATDEHVDVTKGNSQFTNDLFNVLALREGNIFFSPLSAHTVLSMAWQGAQGTTDEAFAKTLHLTNNKVAATGYSTILNNLNNNENVTLSIANKVYLQQDKELLPEFKNTVTKNFKSDVQQLNFANKAESAQTINRWVEQQTNDKIKDIIKEKDLAEDTRLVLVNAIYFKSAWLKPFDERATRGPVNFHIKEGVTAEVEMMENIDEFRYKHDSDLNAQILELPYQNQDFNMVIILPEERYGIKALEEKLKNVELNKITEDLKNEEVIVYLPKFKFETTIDMKESLSKLGLEEIFDANRANFSGIVQNENLVVDKVVQKAFIEVNERGTEAAASTALKAIPMSSKKFFMADHPFIFLIKAQEQILFYGKVAKF